MSGISCASVIQSFVEEGGTSVLTTAPPSLPDHAPRNAPAPPPAPPLPVAVENPTQRKRRVRSFYWKPIPEERVKQHDGRNIWTLGRHSREPLFRIDVRAIEELFGQHDDMLSPTATSIKRPVSVKDVREQIAILDSKRSMNISIFIKHFKKSSECLVDDIHRGNSDVFSVESLRELLKLLPDDDEVKKLKMFNGDPKHLTEADAFIYQLIHVPRYEVRIEALLLKEEFNPSFTSMKHDINIILAAIKELLNCEELHSVLHLVLQAGNIMNDGGYAGNAVGFKLSSLLSLADTKANKPRMNLLHFVALEAEKKDLLMFPEKLLHVENASRIHVELSALSSRIHQMEENIHTDHELLIQLQAFLQSAGESLVNLRVSLDEMVNEGNTLIDFFCEDKETFKLDECFQIFQNFCSKFRKAVQENVERGMWEESRRKRLQELENKRHSWAGHEGKGGVFGLCSSSEADMEAALKREGLLDLLQTNPQSPLCRFGSVRRSWQHKVKTKSANHHNMNIALILPPIHTLSIAHSTINTASNSHFINDANINTHSNTSALGDNGNHTHNSIPNCKSDQDYKTSSNLEPENQNKIKETQEDNLQTQTKPQDTPNLTSDPSQAGLNQSESPPRDDESVHSNSQHTKDLLESLKTSSRPSQLVQTSTSRSSTKTLGSKHKSSANSLSTSKPSSTKSPSTSKPSSTKSPSTSEPSTKSLSTSRPSSTKSPSTSKPSSTKSPSTSKPSSTKSPSMSKPSSTKSPSTSKPSSMKSPSTSKPSSMKLPSTSKPSSTKSPSTSKPSATKSPSTSKPSSVKSPSMSKPSSVKSPSMSKPSSMKSPTSKPPSTKSPSTSKPSSSSTKPKSFPQGSIRTLTSSETQSLRKFVPISHLSSSGPQNQEHKVLSRSSLNSSSAKKRQAVRPPPEEKMCRSTLRALATPIPQNSTNKSANKPAPSFARNTVASTTRHAVVPGNPSAGRPALTRTASLRLSQALGKQQTPASMLSRARSIHLTPPAGHLRKSSSSAISENSVFSRELHIKSVKQVWR